MAKIQRGTIAEEFRKGLDLDSSRTGIYPNEASEKVVLTFDYFNTKEIIPQGMSWTATGGSTTMYAVPAGYKCEIWGYHWAFIKDAACDQATGSFTIGVTVNGSTYSFPLWENLTLTAQSGQGSESFSIPIIVDPSTNVTVTARAFTAGIYRGRVTIMTRLVQA